MTGTRGDDRASGRVRVGVTGHRVLADDGSVDRRVRHALAWIRDRHEVPAGGGVPLTAVSSLAEGADRLVARAILEEPEAELDAPLPLAPDDYEADFAGLASRTEFRALLARGTWHVVSTKPRPIAYEQAGRALVETADVLIAIWDGAPSRGRGGTADIVDYARGRGCPVIVIDPAGRHPIQWPAVEPDAR